MSGDAPRADLGAQQGRIYATADGGYGNRFAPLASGLRLAHLYRREFWFDWKPREEFPVLLSDLFGLDLPFRVGAAPFPIPPPDTDMSGRCLSPARVAPPEPGVDIAFRGHHFVGHHLDERSLAYDSRDPFMRELGGYFKAIPLAPDIAERLARFTERLDLGRTLGVHVRRFIPHSQWNVFDVGRDAWLMETYIQAIDALLDRNPQLTSLYIATNSEAARTQLLARYGVMASSNARAGSGWFTLDALKEAFVEMLVLSRCAAILRQPGSSFSVFASVLELAPTATLASTEPGGAPALDWWSWS